MQSFSTPVRVPDDVLPHRLDGHGHAVVLGTFHHRFQAADEGIERLLGVRIGVHLVLCVGRARLGSHNARPQKGCHAKVPVVPALDLLKLIRIRMGQIQIAAEDSHVQALAFKYPPGIFCQALCQRAVIKGIPLDHLGISEMNAGEPFLSCRLCPFLHGLEFRTEFSMNIMQTNSQLHRLSSCYSKY